MRPGGALLPATHEMRILKAVSLAPLPRYGFLPPIRPISAGRLDVPWGSLYPALYRLVDQDRIAAEWAQNANHGRARFDSPTAVGRGRLRRETAEWNETAAPIASVLNTQPEEI